MTSKREIQVNRANVSFNDLDISNVKKLILRTKPSNFKSFISNKFWNYDVEDNAFALMRDNIRVNTICPGWMDTDGETVIQKKFHNADDDWVKKAEKNFSILKHLASSPYGATQNTLLKYHPTNYHKTKETERDKMEYVFVLQHNYFPTHQMPQNSG